MPDISHFIHGKIFSPGSFEQDWFTNKGFRLGAHHRGTLGVTLGPEEGRGAYFEI